MVKVKKRTKYSKLLVYSYFEGRYDTKLRNFVIQEKKARKISLKYLDRIFSPK